MRPPRFAEVRTHAVRRCAPGLLALMLVLPGCDPRSAGSGGGGYPSVPGGQPPDSGFALEFVAAHDQVRAGATPNPSPALPPMSWAQDVAGVAQKYADGCVYEHNAGRGFLGENIAASSPGLWTPTGVVGAWASEAPDYDYPTNSCAAGQQCGHYTQIVWRNSTAIGCGFTRCTKNSPFAGVPTWDFWVCDYSPPGNYVGEKPY